MGGRQNCDCFELSDLPLFHEVELLHTRLSSCMRQFSQVHLRLRLRLPRDVMRLKVMQLEGRDAESGIYQVISSSR